MVNFQLMSLNSSPSSISNSQITFKNALPLTVFNIIYFFNVMILLYSIFQLQKGHPQWSFIAKTLLPSLWKRTNGQTWDLPLLMILILGKSSKDLNLIEGFVWDCVTLQLKHEPKLLAKLSISMIQQKPIPLREEPLFQTFWHTHCRLNLSL